MHSFRKRRRGAALIEFALVGTLFSALLVAMVMFGSYLSRTNALWNMSREGARFAAVQKPGTPNADNLIKEHIYNFAPKFIDKDAMVITISPEPSARTQASGVTVQIAYDMGDLSKVLFPGQELNETTKKDIGRMYVTRTQMMVESN